MREGSEREGGDLDDWDAHALHAAVCFYPLLWECGDAGSGARAPKHAPGEWGGTALSH